MLVSYQEEATKFKLFRPISARGNREIKQRRRLRKRHLKVNSRWLTIALIPSRLILKDCIKVQEKKKKIVILCSRPRQNVKLGIFTL